MKCSTLTSLGGTACLVAKLLHALTTGALLAAMCPIICSAKAVLPGLLSCCKLLLHFLLHFSLGVSLVSFCHDTTGDIVHSLILYDKCLVEQLTTIRLLNTSWKLLAC